MRLTREIVLGVDYPVNDKATNAVLSMIRFIHAVAIKTHREHGSEHSTKNGPITSVDKVIS
jgi:hypothetical protein